MVKYAPVGETPPSIKSVALLHSALKDLEKCTRMTKQVKLAPKDVDVRRVE